MAEKMFLGQQSRKSKLLDFWAERDEDWEEIIEAFGVEDVLDLPGAKEINDDWKVIPYIVEEGDTLQSVAEQFNTTVDEILELNPKIKKRKGLAANTVIMVPTMNFEPAEVINEEVIDPLSNQNTDGKTESDDTIELQDQEDIEVVTSVEYTIVFEENITLPEQAEKWSNLTTRQIVEEELDYDWSQVYNEFREANPTISGKKLENWIKRSIIEFGWRLGDPVPDYNQILVTYNKSGEPIIEAPNFKMAWHYAVNNLLLPEFYTFYYKNKETKELDHHQYISGSKEVVFNKRLHSNANYKELVDRLYYASGDKELYEATLKDGKIDDAFVELVKSAQEVLFYNKDKSEIDGKLGENTLAALEAWEIEVAEFDVYLEMLIRRYAREMNIRDISVSKATGEFYTQPQVLWLPVSGETTQNVALNTIRNPLQAESEKAKIAPPEIKREENELAALKNYLFQRLGKVPTDDDILNSLLISYPRVEIAPPGTFEWTEKTGQDIYGGRYGFNSKTDFERVKSGYSSLKFDLLEEQKNSVMEMQPKSVQLEMMSFRYEMAEQIMMMADEQGLSEEPPGIDNYNEGNILRHFEYNYYKAWKNAFVMVSTIPEDVIDNNEVVGDEVIEAINKLQDFVFPPGLSGNKGENAGTPRGLWSQSNKSFQHVAKYYDFLTQFVYRRIEEGYLQDLLGFENENIFDPEVTTELDKHFEDSGYKAYHSVVNRTLNEARAKGNAIYKVPAVFSPEGDTKFALSDYNPAEGNVEISDVPISMYIEVASENEYILHVILDPSDEGIFAFENTTFHKCILEMAESGDVLPDGELRYINPFNNFEASVTIRGSTKMSEILGYTALLLVIAAVVATGGLATFFIIAATAVGIGAEGYRLYEEYSRGQLTGTSIALGVLNIVANFLPLLRGFSKIFRVGQNSTKFLSKTGKFLEGGSYFKFATGFDIGVALSDGVIIYDSVAEQISLAEEKFESGEIDEGKRDEMITTAILRGLTLGLVIFAGLRSNIKSLGKSKSGIPLGPTGPQGPGMGPGPNRTGDMNVSGRGVDEVPSAYSNKKRTEIRIKREGDKVYRFNERTNEWDEVSDPIDEKTGKFEDPETEAAYQKYVERKKGQNQEPRGRIDWKETSDYWKYHSSMAKGREFEREITRLADDYDEEFLKGVADKIGISVEELKGYQHLSQVQINLPNGEYFIADNVWIRETTDLNGKTVFTTIVNETKLSAGTSFTSGQQSFVDLVKEGKTSFRTRSVKFGEDLEQGSLLEIKGVTQTVKNINQGYNVLNIYP